MRRLAFPLAALICLALSAPVFAQAGKAAPKAPDAKPATSTAPAPVSEELMKARMRPPVKGTAAIEFIAGPVKVVNGEVQSVVKVKNIDAAPIVGLKIDEYFYAGQKEISACTSRVRNPIAVGEIVDVAMSCPNPKEKATGSNLMFSHQGGGAKVKPTPVKSFEPAKGTTKKK